MFSITLSGLEKSTLQQQVYALCGDGFKLGKTLADFDKSAKLNLVAAAQNVDYKGEFEAAYSLATPGVKGVTGVTVIGAGDAAKLGANSWRKLGIALGRQMKVNKIKKASLVLEDLPGAKVTADKVVELLEGIALVQYSYDELKTKPNTKAVQLEKLTLALDAKVSKAVKAELPLWQAQMEAVELTRDLVNRPANLMTTLDMTAEAKKLAKLGVQVQILGPKELEKMGANLILSVAAGSAYPAQMIVLKWMGAGKNAPVRAAVGKGVMYDTGGYTLKPRDGMSGMKADMAGAAAVLGLMRALAGRKSKVNVIGVCGCAENMVNEKAVRVGDVVKALNGLTVEVNNTDAEGRLVLADCLAYLVKNEKPVEIIDIATLTGACMAALSAYYAGLFTPHDDFAAALTKVGEQTGERLWRLPIGPEFHKQNSSEVADLSNMPTGMGGASSAACFLENFVGKTRWAHLDIAGVGMSGKIPGVTTSLSGATGFGLRLLLNYFETMPKK